MSGVSFFLKLFTLFEVASLEGFRNVVFLNKELVGTEVKKIQNVDWLSCLQLCAADPSCKAYNFKKLLSLCELSSVSISECGAREKSLVHRENSIAHQLYKREVSKTTLASLFTSFKK